MGRTIPSFRLFHGLEELEWKNFRRKLSKEDRKVFDEMFDNSRLYISAYSYSVKPVFMAMVFHNYKQLIGIAEKLRAARA